VQGNITEIRPGVFRVRVYIGRDAKGRTKFRSATVDGKRNAQRRLNEMVSDVQRVAEPVAGEESLAQLLEAYIEHGRHNKHLSPTTLRKYEQLAAHISAQPVGTVKLSKLTPADLDKLYRSETARGLTATSVRRVHTLIGAALHQAEKWGWVTTNVSKRSSPPPVRPKREQPPTVEEVAALIAEAHRRDPQLALLLTFLALTGMRRGEACALRWTDVDWRAETVEVARSLYEPEGGGWAEKPTKTHAHRTVSLDELGVELLSRRQEDAERIAEAVLAELPANAFIFADSASNGRSLAPVLPSRLSHFMTRVAKAAGVKSHLHQLRHFSATQLIAAGVDIVTVAGRLGHRDATVTLSVYAHALARRDKEAAATIGRTLAAVAPPSELLDTEAR
jgi:integrase